MSPLNRGAGRAVGLLARLSVVEVHAARAAAVPLAACAAPESVSCTTQPSTSQHQSQGFALAAQLTTHRSFATSSRRGDDCEGDDSQSVAQQLAAAMRGSKQAKESLEQRAAREVMQDPMSRVLASHGMPLGISMDPVKNASASKAADAVEVEGESQAAKPKTEPDYNMEALDELFQHTMAQGAQGGVPTQASAAQWSTLAAAAGLAAEAMASVPSARRQAAAVAGATGQQQQGQEEEDKVDSWGTTREGPAEIARRIVKSNEDVAAAVEEHEEDDGDDELRLSPGEEKYKTLEQMSHDIKGLDEVFEVLASVPWLDEDDLQQKELKGVARVGLLGTLEEVGFSIRDQVHRIWAGDHDDGMILECGAAKDQAALISILFHTKKIKEQYGPPAKGPMPIPNPDRVDYNDASVLSSLHGPAGEGLPVGEGKEGKDK